jgi:TolA-binding protein
MTVQNILKPAAAMAVALLMMMMAAPASAQRAQQQQGSVTTTDIQRLQDQVYDAGNEVSRLRSRDQVTADRLQAQLDDLRDEAVYLKVKLRKEGSVTRADYTDLRRHVDAVRSEARGVDMSTTDNVKDGRATFPAATTNGNGTGYGTGSGSGTGTSTGTGTSGNGGYYGGTTDAQNPNGSDAPVRRNEVPSGQEIDVRLERPLSSDTAQVEDRFTATSVVDLYQGNTVLIPAGSTLRGVVSSVNKASRTDRKGTLTVAFDQITIRGRSYPIHGTVTQAIESEGIKGEATKIGAGAGVGAIIGGILGGAKGALLGVLIGGGGTIAATDGKDVTLAAGSVLRVRFEQPLAIR